MMEEQINIIDNLIQAISILNKTDEYLESLVFRLSECDSLVSDYAHFIESTPIEEVNLEKLYISMQKNYQRRRIIKNDMILNENYKNLCSRLNNASNRQFLIQGMKNVKSKLGTKYHNRILTSEDVEFLKMKAEKKRRGRPKKVKEGV